MKQLNAFEGQALATEGLNRAVTKADNDHPQWSERCWQWFLVWFGKKQKGSEFMIETFRRDVLAWGKIEKPNSDRAFGFISKRAVKEGLIVGAGTAKTKSKDSHGTPANVWRKL